MPCPSPSLAVGKQAGEVGGSLRVHRGSPWCSQNHSPGLCSFPERGARAEGKGHGESAVAANSHRGPPLPPTSSFIVVIVIRQQQQTQQAVGENSPVSGAALHPFHCSFNPHYDTTRLYFPLSEMGRVRLRKAQKSGPSHTASKPGQSGRTFNYSIMLPAALMGFGEGGRGVVLPPTYCVTLGKSFYLSKPQSPHL